MKKLQLVFKFDGSGRILGQNQEKRSVGKHQQGEYRIQKAIKKNNGRQQELYRNTVAVLQHLDDSNNLYDFNLRGEAQYTAWYMMTLYVPST